MTIRNESAQGLNLLGIAAFVAANDELVSDEQGTLAEQEEGDR